MIEKRFTIKSQDDLFGVVDNYSADKICVVNGIRTEIETKWLCDVMNDLNDENEELKKGMIGVVDRYIKNVECNPPSSARTYMKIKGALVNIREDLRNLIGRFE